MINDYFSFSLKLFQPESCSLHSFMVTKYQCKIHIVLFTKTIGYFENIYSETAARCNKLLGMGPEEVCYNTKFTSRDSIQGIKA